MNISTLYIRRIIVVLITFFITVITLSSCRIASTETIITNIPANYETEYYYIKKTVDSPDNNKLSLEILINHEECFNINTDIPIRLIFINTSQMPLFLQNRFYLSKSDFMRGGDLTVSILLPDGTKVYNYYTYYDEDWSPPQMGYIEIKPQKIFEYEIFYRFPDKLKMYNIDEPIITVPQIYSISVTYDNYAPLDVGAWVGSIDSNKESLCIN